MRRRVVITGMGIYSCIGTNKEEVKESLFNGRSGIGIDIRRTEMGFASPLTGMVPRPDRKKFLDRRSRHYLAEEGEYAYMATLEALQEAGIDNDFLESREVGILYGNDSSAAAVIEGVDIMREKHNTALVGSSAIFKAMNSTVTMTLSTIFKLRGINLTISGACASGSHAIGLGYLLIRDGLQECIVCGGAQEVNPYAVGAFDGLGAFSKRTDNPAAASRPFDKERDGLVPGGGGATVIIESYDSAIARGAHIIADGNEARAITEVFGNTRPYVTSTKGQTGHEMWMAGTSEVIYSILMMNNHFIAPNLNYTEGDEATSLLNIPTERVEMEFDRFLSNSFGFGGTNSSLIIGKFKDNK